jgi:hypothetical protein
MPKTKTKKKQIGIISKMLIGINNAVILHSRGAV